MYNYYSDKHEVQLQEDGRWKVATGFVCIQQKRLAGALGYSERAIRYAVKYLLENGFIKVYNPPGMNRVNRYTICWERVAWRVEKWIEKHPHIKQAAQAEYRARKRPKLLPDTEPKQPEECIEEIIPAEENEVNPAISEVEIEQTDNAVSLPPLLDSLSTYVDNSSNRTLLKEEHKKRTVAGSADRALYRLRSLSEGWIAVGDENEESTVLASSAHRALILPELIPLKDMEIKPSIKDAEKEIDNDEPERELTEEEEEALWIEATTPKTTIKPFVMPEHIYTPEEMDRIMEDLLSEPSSNKKQSKFIHSAQNRNFDREDSYKHFIEDKKAERANLTPIAKYYESLWERIIQNFIDGNYNYLTLSKKTGYQHDIYIRNNKLCRALNFFYDVVKYTEPGLKAVFRITSFLNACVFLDVNVGQKMHNESIRAFIY
jgi:hypothetical protein